MEFILTKIKLWWIFAIWLILLIATPAFGATTTQTSAHISAVIDRGTAVSRETIVLNNMGQVKCLAWKQDGSFDLVLNAFVAFKYPGETAQIRDIISYCNTIDVVTPDPLPVTIGEVCQVYDDPAKTKDELIAGVQCFQP